MKKLVRGLGKVLKVLIKVALVALAVAALVYGGMALFGVAGLGAFGAWFTGLFTAGGTTVGAGLLAGIGGWGWAAIAAGSAAMLYPDETASAVSDVVNGTVEIVGEVVGTVASALGIDRLFLWIGGGVLAYFLLTSDSKSQPVKLDQKDGDEKPAEIAKKDNGAATLPLPQLQGA